MGEGEEIETMRILLVGICGMFAMAVALISFFVTYQKRLLKQQQEQRQLEAQHQKELLKASIMSQEHERQRIAKDLHDDIGALLATSKLYVGQLLEETTGESQLKITRKVDLLHKDMIQTVRRIAQDLRPVVLEKMGLIAAVNSLVAHINETGSLTLVFESEENLSLGQEKDLELYRIIQELITNTIKHAQAKRIDIKLFCKEGFAVLEYKDNGKGFNTGKMKQQRLEGLGLKNIESRVSILNGKVTYQDRKGFGIAIKIPQKTTIMS